jgi:hypothetical protein
VGDYEAGSPGSVESLVKYHSSAARFLTHSVKAGVWTMSGGRFDWGGRLLKSNGGARRSPYAGWKSALQV